ncbi:e3 SUMO-protein ligase NSE2 [Trichonephila clavata]|uniref:E3 SUMO-protein ligase NSE2 n=1 Tax=Trichonephila clavata TaxID=2740835 RepID=A0A8X6KA32_TRICU|nr:e3 SUMO-protein ligase NSE2 [Trichonephila clavata]
MEPNRTAFNLPSVLSEKEDLNTVNSILLETFKLCNEMKTDLVEYSNDTNNDLTLFKENVMDIAGLQKDLSALIDTVDSIEAEISEDSEPNLEQVSTIFDRVHLSNLQNQQLNEEAESIINAVDTYFSNQNSSANIDTELQVTDAIDSYKDPITKALIEDPVKSKKCNHSFERKSILDYLQKYNKCPYSGCVSILRKDDIVEDLALKRKLMNMR